MKKRLLLVEDDLDDQLLFSMALADNGIDVELCCCLNGKEALTKMADFQPELIISDYNMPVMDGPQLLVELRRAGNKVPVIMYSTTNLDPAIIHALGAQTSFEKPGSYEEFKSLLRLVLAEYLFV